MGASFLGNDHSISLDEAKKMTKKFREMRERILSDEFKDKNVLAKCESFDRKAFDTLLQREDCVGVRLYCGMDENDMVHSIIVGFDADGKDILPINNIVMDDVDPQILENSARCPEVCPPPSELNS